MVRLIILARLLVPEDFGLMAMVTVVIGFAEIFSDGGISSAIIYRQDTSRDQLASLYWLNIFAGITVFLLVWATIPFVVQFYGESRLADLMSWTALIFLIAPIGQQFRILLQKELEFKRLAQVMVLAAVIGTVVAVWSALSGQGVFSLVWGQLAAVTTRTLLLARLGWKKAWAPSFHFSTSDLKGYIGFGAYHMGTRMMGYVSSNVDYFIIGRFLGAEVLGVYMLAYRLVVLPLTKLNPVLTQVAFPVFARKQADNAALRRGYLQMIRMIAFMTFPVLVMAGMTAHIFVPLLLGEKWLPAVPFIQILVVLGLLKSMVQPMVTIMLAKGRPDIGFKWSLATATINACVFWVVVAYGAITLALANVGLTGIYFMVSAVIILRPLIRLRVSDYLRVLLRPTVFSASMGVMLLGVYSSLSEFAMSDTTLLLTVAVFGILVYGALMLIFERQYVVENWHLLVNKGERV